MLESNNDEERLARIERMIEALRRESATIRTVAAKRIVVKVSSVLAVRGVPQGVPVSGHRSDPTPQAARRSAKVKPARAKVSAADKATPALAVQRERRGKQRRSIPRFGPERRSA